MAKKDSKVSINNVDKYLKGVGIEYTTLPYFIEDPENVVMEIKVKSRLTFVEMTEMIRTAADAVFFDVDGEETYRPEFEEVAKANAILIYVANFKEEMSISRVHDLMYAGVVANIISHWNTQQFDDFEASFRRCVNYRKDVLIAGERVKLMQMSEQLDKAISAMQVISDAYSDIDSARLQEVVDALSGMSELSLAEAVVDARDNDFVARRAAKLEVVK